MVQTTLRDRIQSIEDAISAGQIDDAMAHCQQILARYPDALEIQRLLGEVYLAQGRFDEAQQTFDWILVNDPENVIAYCDRALICEHLSDIDTALDCYQQAYELSRGNSQIRREFNQLSARVGQQEFMMSRAGLARLYMRGDLLTQAIQEWEAVLVTGPERLDARLGLLETYWREGMYDQAEQIASRILEEVPNCVKALLLLAHITSAFNLQRARELIQRAEILDPELVMAQELFNDLSASQPNDPFLPLIRKDPILLEEPGNGYKKPIEAINTLEYASIEVNKAEPSDKELSADRLYNWNGMDNLSALDARTVVQAGSQPEQEVAWSDDTNIEQVETWATNHISSQNQPVDDFEAWATQQEIDDDFDPALLEQQPWFQAEQASTPAAEPVEQAHTEGSDAVKAPREEEVPAPPAWLDMLTKSERRQPSGAMPPVREQSASPEQPKESAFQRQDEPDPAPRQSWEDEFRTVPASPEQAEAISPFIFAPDDKDEDMGWPEWLKSLGAESIEAASDAEQRQPSTFSAWSDLQQPAQAPKPTYDSWTGQLQPAPAAHEPEPSRYSSWEEQIDQTMSEADRQQLATLETLEKSLLSQGFVPLQPGSLSTIAQEASLTPAPKPSSSPPIANPSEMIQPVLPVAELSKLSQPEAPVGELAHEQAQPLPSSPTIPLDAPDLAPTPEWPAYPANEPVATPVPQEEPILATNRIEPAINAAARQEGVLMPAYRADAFLENELETTMKRPAVRLQPMHTPAIKTDHPYSADRGRSADRLTGGKAAESAMSNKERLLKGYQYQLAGAYDEAMQEYRILIRNAPELLGDLISNVRALLRLAPKYTAGYRVLGDAYMRQGEYLQAMEAYNKALTIAKKAKGLSH